MLYSLNSADSKVRSDIIYEIKHFVHCLLTKVQVSLSVGFLHKCGLTFNEYADRAAKRGAINNTQSTILDFPLVSKQMCNSIENDTWKRTGFSRLISHYTVLNNNLKQESLDRKTT